MQTVHSSATFESRFPLMAIRDGCIISKRGDITLGYELTLPPLYSQTEDGYDDMLTALTSAVKVLPDWTLVHRQDIYTYSTYHADLSRQGFLAQSYERHFDGRRYLRHTPYLFLTFSSRTSALKITGSCGIYGIRSTAAFPTAETLRSAAQAAADFVAVLTSGGLVKARTLTDDDLLGSPAAPGILDRYLTLGRDDFLMSDIGLAPDSVTIGEDTLLGFSISETDPLPGTISSTQRVDPLSGSSWELKLSFGAQLGSCLDCEHIVNHYILTCNQTTVMQEMDRRRKRMTSMSQHNAANRLGAEEIQTYTDAVVSSSLTTVRSHLNVLAWGRDRTEIRGKVSAALSTLGISGVQNTCDTPVLWYAGMPGAGCELGEDNLMLMELRSAAALSIFETFDGGLKGGGCIRLCDRTRGIPVPLDIQERAAAEGLIGNMNALLMGSSGTGKSFSTNAILHDLYTAGQSIFVVDVGDSYQGLCSLIHEESEGHDGIYHSWDRDHPLRFSLFPGWHDFLDADGRLRQDNNSVNFVMSFLRTCWVPEGGWTPQAITILGQIITDFLTSMTGDPRECLTMDDFYAFLASDIKPRITAGQYSISGMEVGLDRFDAVSMALAMVPYTSEGSYGFLLNSATVPDLATSRFTVFEVDQLSKADDKFYSLCILCIMNAFDIKMRGLQGTKVMVIDEAWKAIANETMAPYLTSLWKTARKFRTSAMVVTQQLSDIMSSAVIRDTILKNSDVKILLDQSSSQNSFDEIATLLGLSPHDKNLVLSINRGHRGVTRSRDLFLSLGEKFSGVYTVEVSPEQALAFESEKIRKAPLLARAEQLGSLIEAIREAAGGPRP